MTARSYKIDELARAAGMSVRTVRYYVQRGLLAAPEFRGKDTAYEHAHLVRLRAIRKLQEAYFPLDAIAAELGARTSTEVERIADGKELPVPPGAAEPLAPAARAPGSVAAGVRAASLASRSARSFRRIELLPGVELVVDDDAPAQSVERVEAMLALLDANVTNVANVTGGGRRR